MSDTETRFFVQAFVRFLNKQIVESGFPADTAESLEVAVQCLETAYNLPVETASDAAGPSADPMTHTDLHQLFQTACAAHPDRKREADLIKNEGNKLMREEKYEEALLCYNRAIALDAANPVFYCNRAATYSRLGDFQKAAEDCKLSLRYDPNYSKAYGRLGIAYSKLNNLDLAVDAYTKALELEPNNVDYLNNLNVAKQQLEDSKQTAASAATATNNASSAPSGNATPRPDATRPPGRFPFNLQIPGLEDFQSFMNQPTVQDLFNRVVSDPSQMSAVYESIRSAESLPTGPNLTNLLNGGAGVDVQALFNSLSRPGPNSSTDSSPSHP